MLLWIPLALMGLQSVDAEARVVEYLRRHVTPGERVVVSQLYNEVFTSLEERAALDRLFNTFFKIPLHIAQFQRGTGRPPTLAEIAEQFRLGIPGEADVMLRIMDSDPRMPGFLVRDAKSGEILRVEVSAILAHPRFGRIIERTIAGWEGRPAPSFAATSFDGVPVGSEALARSPYVLYFWFSGCPPCVKTSPLLVELDRVWGPRGLKIVGLNADRLLELPYADEDRAAYARKLDIRFTLAHLTSAIHEAYGSVSVFPTLVFVDRQGMIVRHFVSAQPLEALDAAARLALQ